MRLLGHEDAAFSTLRLPDDHPDHHRPLSGDLPELERLPFHAALVAQERAGFGEVHAVLIQLDLTDAQWGQIQRLRETVSDRKQRLQAIPRILTPAQRTRFDALRAAQARTETPSVPAS